MNSLLILLYVVVWRVCTILRVIVPVSAVRAWCEYQLEGMTILRDAYSSLVRIFMKGDHSITSIEIG